MPAATATGRCTPHRNTIRSAANASPHSNCAYNSTASQTSGRIKASATKSKGSKPKPTHDGSGSPLTPGSSLTISDDPYCGLVSLRLSIKPNQPVDVLLSNHMHSWPLNVLPCRLLSPSRPCRPTAGRANIERSDHTYVSGGCKSWFELADISDHLDSAKTGSLVARRRTQSWKPNNEQTSTNDQATEKEPRRLPTARREVPRSGAQSTNGKRTGKPAVNG
jgi:hypothetical protein